MLARSFTRRQTWFSLVLLSVVGLAASSTSHAQEETAQASDQQTQAIEALAGEAAVAEALQYIEEASAQTQADQVRLTEIPAPPFNEGRRAKAYRAMLREAGADSTWIDEEGNVLALRRGQGGGQRTVALGAHLDTVFPEGTDVTVEMRGDTLYAPGIGDDARGLTVLLTMLRAFEEANIATEGDLLFVGTVGEEGLGDLRGVKHLFRTGGPSIDAWIALDGASIGRVVHRALGSHRYRVTFKGPGGHSWGAFGRGNPHHALGRAITYFADEADAYTQEGPRTSYNVGRIGGGTSVNSIPFESWMEVDMRSVDSTRLNGIDTLFRQAVQRALEDQRDLRRRGDSLTVDVEMIGDRPSGAVPAEDPLVQRAMATASHFGAEPALGISSTDSNTPIAKGIPAVTIGGGGEGGNAHSPQEWWLGRDAYLGVQRAFLLTLAQAGRSQ